jgi:hypothetical protein
MKRLQWAVAMVLLALAQYAYANSIPTFTAQANITFLQNFAGDNLVGATFSGPGVSIVNFGGDVVCFTPRWCTLGESFSPGSTLKPSIDLIDFGFVKGNARFGGQVHPVDILGGLPQSAITALGNFTFPTHGNGAFTVIVPARLNGPIMGQTSDFFAPFNLQIPYGRLVLTFDFFPAGCFPGGRCFPASYGFSRGRFTTLTGVPEPGTLGLMGSGLAGILGAVLRKRKLPGL